MDQHLVETPSGLDMFLDEAGPVHVKGWAWMPDRPEETVRIELLDASGGVVAGTEASKFRADLQTAGKREGRCAFEIEVPAGAEGPLDFRARSPSDARRDVLLAARVRTGAPESGPASGPLQGPDGIVGYLDRADIEELRGWCHAGRDFNEPVTLELAEGGETLTRVCADRWRSDIEDLRQGDGRCGFRITPPARLYDGGEHRLDLRLPGGPSLLARPLALRFPEASSAAGAAPTAAPSKAAGPSPALSVVVNFYNMEREAGRTLLALSRRFQEGVQDLSYEVLCVDNGSDPPLDPSFVASFGPEFRLVRTAATGPSPCAALNEAAAQARGRVLAIMIDGAHILSAGTLREAHAALQAQPDSIVALRQWFIGGDQRWLSSIGYSRAQEDLLFARIAWPEHPYALFAISSPMYESPNSWFDGISESNCLFVPADIYRRIGGFDERFDMPGAGFANLDLFRRAAEAAEAVIALVGEASFHQYHHGVTTNIGEEEKERRVRAYASHYEQVRGHAFAGHDFREVRLAGGIRTSSALVSRQRPYLPIQLGLTEHVRPRLAAIQFDEEAQRYLQSAYVETGRYQETRWAGEPVGVAPSDLLDIQEALWRAQPQCVVVRNGAPGLARFVAAILPTLGLEGTRVLWSSPAEAAPPAGVAALAGGVDEAAAVHEAERQVGDAERVLALYRPGPQDSLPVEALTAWSRLVTFESYLVVLGVAIGQPWLGYSRAWTYQAIRRFLQRHPGFVIDRTLNRHFVTTCPSGFLRRVLDPVAAGDYDPLLDDLEGL